MAIYSREQAQMSIKKIPEICYVIFDRYSGNEQINYQKTKRQNIKIDVLENK